MSDSEAHLRTEAPTSVDPTEIGKPDSGESCSETCPSKEETPVIDVHAPHGGVHTWKDFWIHLGTITLGLLIAISLEQSVEWLHHLRQRHQLEADLRQEGIDNQNLAENDWRVIDDRMATASAKLREVESPQAVRRKAAAPFPASSFAAPPPTAKGSFVMPLSAVWTTAKEGAAIDLLPRDVARGYTRLYLQVDILQQLASPYEAGGNGVAAFECRFNDGTLPCKPDLSQMTDEELGEYSGLLTRYFTLLRVIKARVLGFEAKNGKILDGDSADTPNGALTKLAAKHPDTFLRPQPATSAK